MKPQTPLRIGPVLACSAAFVLAIVIVIAGRGYSLFSAEEIREFEVGKVADRDVIAEQDFSYVDEEVTRQRLLAQEKLVSAVFTYSTQISGEVRDAYNQYAGMLSPYLAPGRDPANSREAFETSYLNSPGAPLPEALDPETLNALFRLQNRERLPALGAEALEYLLDVGIFSLPPEITETYNPFYAELRHNYGPRTEREQISYERTVTLDKAEDAIARFVAERSLPQSFGELTARMLSPFLRENVFFSPEATMEKIAELRARMDPAVKRIERGERIIRKGFIVTEEDIAQLQALSAPRDGFDKPILAGQTLAFCLLFGFFIFMVGAKSLKRILKPPEVYFLCALSVFYLGGAAFLKNLALLDGLPSALFMPTALLVMLPSILIGAPLAVSMAILLPLSAFLAGSFDMNSYVFALASGVAAAFVLPRTERRIDLIFSGGVIAMVNMIAILATALLHREPFRRFPPLLALACVNGVTSGILALGCLPLLETILNSVTAFRLVELSDLNSPILKKLFRAAPGTYSHSIMVANLAENACQEIGANPLLARVGAYYHDIGKIDQPDYFVENQTVYNKHDDIAPRLSATVIRSHVKLGVEKARNLGLPKEVVDIVAEHHGNSLITWFYNEALKREAQVNPEDFSYPGTPPHSRESAAVMLADVTEAAARTLKKPTASRLEKFIQELIMGKFEHGQLSESELTFKDLETIKQSFVRVLAGYYHSRIEYPKQPKAAGEEGEEDAVPAQGAAPGSGAAPVNAAEKEEEE